MALLVTVVGGVYATDIRSSFSNEDFLPPEDNPDYIEALPEPLAPSDYSVTETTNYLEDNFASGESDTVTVYIEAPCVRTARWNNSNAPTVTRRIRSSAAGRPRHKAFSP